MYCTESLLLPSPTYPGMKPEMLGKFCTKVCKLRSVVQQVVQRMKRPMLPKAKIHGIVFFCRRPTLQLYNFSFFTVTMKPCAWSLWKINSLYRTRPKIAPQRYKSSIHSGNVWLRWGVVGKSLSKWSVHTIKIHVTLLYIYHLFGNGWETLIVALQCSHLIAKIDTHSSLAPYTFKTICIFVYTYDNTC